MAHFDEARKVAPPAPQGDSKTVQSPMGTPLVNDWAVVNKDARFLLSLDNDNDPSMKARASMSAQSILLIGVILFAMGAFK